MAQIRNNRNIWTAVIFVLELLVLVGAGGYSIYLYHLHKTAVNLQANIRDNFTPGSAYYKLDSLNKPAFLLDSGIMLNSEIYSNLSVVYSDSEIREMTNEELATALAADAVIFKDFDFSSDMNQYGTSLDADYEDQDKLDHVTRNRAAVMAYDKLAPDSVLTDMKVYGDVIDGTVIWKFVITLNSGDRYAVYMDEFGRSPGYVKL